MPLFSAAQAAAMAGSTVRMSTLVDFYFRDMPIFLWNGLGPRGFGGKTYIGAGDLGAVEGLEEVRGSTSSQVTFTLSGVADSPVDLLAAALDVSDIVQGSKCVVSVQLFHNDWTELEGPIPLYFGICQQPRVTREQATYDTGARRVLTLPAENLFYGRARPVAGRYTDREQRQRYPGDLFCQYTSQLVNLSITWPDFLWLFTLSSVVALSYRLFQGTFC